MIELFPQLTLYGMQKKMHTVAKMIIHNQDNFKKKMNIDFVYKIGAKFMEFP